MSEHTMHSIGETGKLHLKEFRAFAAKAEAKTDKALRWWEKSHWSALIGFVLLAAAVAFGIWLSRLV